MAPTSGSKSSTSKRPKGARSEPEASEARTAREPNPRPGLVLIGQISGAHGLKGELRLHSYAEDAETLAGVSLVTIEGERPDAPDLRLELVSATDAGPDKLRLRLDRVNDRSAAEALVGRHVWVDPSELPVLPEGEVYGHELIGCELFDESGAAVGRVRDVWRTGAPDVLVVDGADGREHLIPAALLRDLDTAARRAVVEIVPGLLDADAPDGADEAE